MTEIKLSFYLSLEPQSHFSSSQFDFSKIAQLKACNSIYKHDFICLSEKYLDSPTPLNDNSLQIEGYNHSHHKKGKIVWKHGPYSAEF